MATSKTLHGARMACYVNGKRFGNVMGFSFQSATPKQAIYGIDSTEPFELSVSTTKIAGSLTIYRTIGDGGAQGAQVSAPYASLPKEKYWTLTIVDIGTDTVFFSSDTCSTQNESWSVERSTIKGQISFEALDWNNEVPNQ